MTKIELTHRAMLDLNEINEYSIQKFRPKTAGQYLDDIEAALLLIQEQPKLLVSKMILLASFSFILCAIITLFVLV